jgi:hypothetical protein
MAYSLKVTDIASEDGSGWVILDKIHESIDIPG